VRPARLAGLTLAAGLAAMLALNLAWIVRNAGTLGGTRAGEPAPHIDLPLLDGGRARIEDARGQRLVLSFWATWCGPCVGELPDVQRLAEELAGKGVRVMTVNVDGEGAAPVVREFRQHIGLKLPIALDDGSASQAFRVDTIPRTVIIDADGKIARVLDGAHTLADMRRAVELAQ
jgi:thiol-disulfide isomerase/thioredoxin